nr:immunoglobulin heavy chain junction region [Mus musculus]MBK4196332.1 immunoglobulin heavy chain junction region [Mus musculus]
CTRGLLRSWFAYW